MLNKTSDLMKKYFLLSMTIPISDDTERINSKIKELRRIKEEKKVEDLLKKIDYQIGKFFDKIKISR